MRREPNRWGDRDAPRWLFVVHVRPVADGPLVPVFQCFDASDAAVVAAALGRTLEVPARDWEERPGA